MVAFRQQVLGLVGNFQEQTTVEFSSREGTRSRSWRQ
jgi:hypothetical protein